MASSVPIWFPFIGQRHICRKDLPPSLERRPTSLMPHGFDRQDEPLGGPELEWLA